jgi:hypothetical protein
MGMGSADPGWWRAWNRRWQPHALKDAWHVIPDVGTEIRKAFTQVVYIWFALWGTQPETVVVDAAEIEVVPPLPQAVGGAP